MGVSVRKAGKQPPLRITLTCSLCGQGRAVTNGAYLRWRRERAGLDQRTLAKRLKVSGPYLSDIERNRRDCPFFIEVAYRRLKR